MLRDHIHIWCAALVLPLVFGYHGQILAADGAATQPAVDTPQMSWPRTFTQGDHSLVMYPPQVDAWQDFKKIKFRAALALTPGGTGPVQYGVMGVDAETMVDHDARLVILSGLDVDLRFPGVSAEKEAEYKKIAKECLPKKDYVAVPLDEVLAYVHNGLKPRTADVNLKPPPIFHSEVPAILVVYIGQPQFKQVKDTKLMFAVNTNWVVLMDMASSQYYLQNGKTWLTAPDALKGPWVPTDKLPDEFSKLPEGEQWKEVRAAMPPALAKVVTKIITSTEPAELIATDGDAEYTPVTGTRLMYISNPDMPVFLDLVDNNFYYLVAGRWFRSQSIDGPWTAASSDLPAEFAKIPSDSTMGYVLASIPKTQEAQDAVLMAQVPHKATLSIQNTKLTVAYEGDPKFQPIQGTAMSYAVNTAYEVVQLDNQYYCCYQGAWFSAPAATGPWTLCSSVPQAIYTIPASCPVYNATYVNVYGVDGDNVVYGYTGGYSGEYVAATGTLMFGAGLVTGAAISNWCCCNPCYYSYGCAAHYSYAYGGYYRAGAAYYGPHGGCGWGAAYNPATGAWARGGYAYGPAGAHWGAAAYNPFTNTYAAHAGATNGYQSWGKSAVSHDGKWAQSGHVSGAAGTAGYIDTSSGKSAEGVHTAGGTTAVKTNNGDVYAGKDGNVYKNTGNGWQKYNGNGNWEDTSWNKSKPAASTPPGDTASRWNQQESARSLNTDSWARSYGSSNAFSSFQSRFDDRGTGGFGGGRFGGSSWGGGGRFGGGGFGGFRGRR